MTIRKNADGTFDFIVDGVVVATEADAIMALHHLAGYAGVTIVRGQEAPDAPAA